MPNLSFGLVLTLIGMGIVFSILGLMVLSLKVLAKAHNYFLVTESAGAIAVEENATTLERDQAEADNFEEIIAAISIAVEACQSEEVPKVIPIRQQPRATNGWGLAGRMKILERWSS